jgi:hypothetical protein
MKKFLITITAFVYLTVSSGATVNLHYCMGKLMSWDLSAKSKSKCSSCGMEKSGHKGCCNDEQKTFKVDKDQKVSEFNFHSLTISFEALTPTFRDLPLLYIYSAITENTAANGPPLQNAVPIFLRNRNFRI